MAECFFNQCADGKNKLLENDERIKFCNNLLPTIWVVESKIPDTENEWLNGTAFCIHPSGLLMTCAHNILSMDEKDTFPILLVESEKEFRVTIERKYDAWDIAILRVEGNGRQFDYVRFADDGDTISCGEEIHTIGNPKPNCGSFVSGRVAYPFDGFSIECLTDSRVTGRESRDGPNPPYRTLGTALSSCGVKNVKCDPKLPIIQVSQTFCREGASGSPVFDNRGYVVGMFFAIVHNYNLAVPFMLLKHFLSDDTRDDSKPKEQPKPTREGKNKNAPHPSQVQKHAKKKNIGRSR